MKPLKLTPWEIFARYRVGPDSSRILGPATRESLSVVFDPYNTTQSAFNEVATSLKKELLRRINRDLYKLVKQSLQSVNPPLGESHTYVQFGRRRLFGGMYLGVIDEPTIMVVENKLTIYVTFKAYIDPKEVRQLET